MTISSRLFGEEEKAMKKERTPLAGRDNLNAFLGEGTGFKGTLTFEGTVRIDGKLEGEIFTKDTLVVGETASVQATVHAGVIVISGTVKGDITAEQKVEIHSTGRLYGNITTPTLMIEEGVVFEGSCAMGKKSGPAETRAPNAAPPPDQERILTK